jgi:hypothetical protein
MYDVGDIRSCECQVL